MARQFTVDDCEFKTRLGMCFCPGLAQELRKLQRYSVANLLERRAVRWATKPRQVAWQKDVQGKSFEFLTKDRGDVYQNHTQDKEYTGDHPDDLYLFLVLFL